MRLLAQAILLFFWSAATVWASEPKGPSSHGTNIFAPASTPAKSIADLSVFVLVITGIIFVVVFALLVYSVVKFRGRATDAGREPPQVYGSTQIELAWTIIPILIVVVLFLATARVIHAIQDAPEPAGAVQVTAIGHQYWWEFRYPETGDRHSQRTAHPGERSRSSDPNVSAVAFGRYRPQLLGAGACRQDRPHSEPPQQNVDGSATHGHLSRPVCPVLRNTAREDAAPRFGGWTGGFCRLGSSPAETRSRRRRRNRRQASV